MDFLTSSFVREITKLVNSRGFSLLVVACIAYLLFRPMDLIPAKLDRIVEILATAGCLQERHIVQASGDVNGNHSK